MINRKGFTLVELLAVLVILAVISTIAFPIVSDMIKDSEQRAYEQQIKTFQEAAKNWAADNSSLLIEIDDNDEMYNISCYVTVSRLKEEGYLEAVETIDPTDNTLMDSYVVSLVYEETESQYRSYNNIYINEEEAKAELYTAHDGTDQYLDKCPYPESE